MPQRTGSGKQLGTRVRGDRASSSSVPTESMAAGARERQMKSRQPKSDMKNDGKNLRNSGKVKQAIVSKLSETIGENVNCFGIGMSFTLC